MIVSRRLALRSTLAIGALSALPGIAFAQGASEQQAVIDGALKTVQDLRTDKAFGTARDLMHRARAILIVPSIIKAGFFFGGEGGNGVLLTRQNGSWSNPAFYSLGSASFGLQIGVQVSETVLFIMSQRALDAILANKVKIGAAAGITAVNLGSNVEAATSTSLRGDIVVWASSSGAYVGLTLNGSVIEPRASFNQAYYGRPLSTRDVTVRRTVRNPGAAPLVAAVSSLA